MHKVYYQTSKYAQYVTCIVGINKLQNPRATGGDDVALQIS